MVNNSYHWSRALLVLLFSFVITGVGIAEPVYLNTPEGIRRLHQSDLSNPYYLVAPYVDTQENTGFCGPASLAAVLNSLPALPRPAANPYKPYHYFTQANLFNSESSQVKTYETVARSGLTLAEASRFLEKLNVSTRIYYGTNLSIDTLRVLLVNTLSNPDARVIADFGRHVFGQLGDGHYSPLVAYDSASDSVLIVDVAKFKYVPFWVSMTDLLASIQTIDPDSHQSRGLIVVFQPNPRD